MYWIKKSKLHLSSQNETYFQHLICAAKISAFLCILSVKCFVHAFLPFLFTTAVSDKFNKLEQLTNRDQYK
jgi:hypothetical protein